MIPIYASKPTRSFCFVAPEPSLIPTITSSPTATPSPTTGPSLSLSPLMAGEPVLPPSEDGTAGASNAPTTDADINTTESPTLSTNDQPMVATAGTSKAEQPVGTNLSFDLYSLTFELEDAVQPTRSQDYYDLTSSTQSVLKRFMDRTFKEYPLSILVDFQTELVRTGMSSGSAIFVVFQSTAVFDSGSFVIPEASQVEGTLREAFAKDQELWFEYISALQELDPDNAFSSVINVVYSTEIPSETSSSSQSSSTTTAAIAAAAAGVAILSIGFYVIKRRHDSMIPEDSHSTSKDFRSRFFGYGTSTATVAETAAYDASSVAVRRGGPDTSSDKDDTDAEEGTISDTIATSNDDGEVQDEVQSKEKSHADSYVLSNAVADQMSGRKDDWDDYRTYSFADKEDPEDENDDDCSNYSDDAIGSQIQSEESIEAMSQTDESSRKPTRRWHAWRERSKAREQSAHASARSINEKENAPLLHADQAEGETLSEDIIQPAESKAQALHALPKPQGSAKENNDYTKQTEKRLEQQKQELDALKRLQEESKRHDEANIAKKKEALEEWLRRENVARLNEENRLVDERLKSELAKIKAEEAARTAEEFRLKEEMMFVAEKEAFEARLRMQRETREVEERKLRRARANFEALILEEKKERLLLERHLADEKKAADDALKAAEEKAKRAERKIKDERLKLNAAKKALEIKQQVQEKDESLLLLKEEEEYLRRIRAEELARNENLKAEREAALAFDIRKLQELKFEEKERALQALHSKEINGVNVSSLNIVTETDADEGNSRAIWPNLSEDDSDAERMAIALRLAQSWESSSVNANCPQKDHVTGVRLARSWDSKALQETQIASHDLPHADPRCDETEVSLRKGENPISSKNDCASFKNVHEMKNEQPDDGDADDSSDTSEVAILGTRSTDIEDHKEGEEEPNEKGIVPARSQGGSRTLQDYAPKLVPKIGPPRFGPAQFIAPWSDDTNGRGGQDIDRKKKGKRSNHTNPVKRRSFNVAGRDQDNDGYAESQSSEKTPDPDFRIGDCESIESDDTCSLYSARTDATTASGFPKMFPR